ncbi:GNAT family N-acetyltransferase [Croceibacterium sp. TMG7-5b_MA50]|uniref:GNAT family N-acetyltransferase n=1 Tax=Croceibacterium sp. TMG7-5b_MA50 TaxID=3121290 RepID=UPI003221CBF8
MTDALDAAMAVMEAAFDPAFGEAWTRRQLGDTLLLPGTGLLLAGADGEEPADGETVAGFALTRQILDEEELLLLAVHPDWRRCGIGASLLQRVITAARARGVARLFLEMRDGNPAMHLYADTGFQQSGRRRDYYRRGISGPFDAITCDLAL